MRHRTTERHLQNPKLSNSVRGKKGSAAFYPPPLPATATSGARNSPSLREAGKSGGYRRDLKQLRGISPEPLPPLRSSTPRSWNQSCKRRASSLPPAKARTHTHNRTHTGNTDKNPRGFFLKAGKCDEQRRRALPTAFRASLPTHFAKD